VAPRTRKGWARLSLRVAAIAAQGRGVKDKRKHKQPPGLFCGFWTEPKTGRRLGRASRIEIAVAYRLRSDHADILYRRAEGMR
jgi:hypothetical protein